MAGTTNLPLTTINGTQTFGPANVNNNDHLSVLTIDRTVAGGLDSLTSASTLEMLIEQSNDGGTTWFELADALFIGGPRPAPFKGAPGTDNLWVTFEPGTQRRVRATLTTVNGAITVQGTLTTS